MKKLQFIFILCLMALFVNSCSDNKIQSGIITYDIEYPYNEIDGMMGMMMPKEMTLTFKDGKTMSTIEKGKMFTTKIISDENQRLLEFRLDFGSDVISTHLTPENLDAFIESQIKYTVEGPLESDSLLGVSTQKYNIKPQVDSLGTFESLFSMDFSTKNAAWFTSYGQIKGMPLDYYIDRYGIIMHLKARDIQIIEIDDKAFEPQESYEDISYEKFDAKIRDLYTTIFS